MSTNDETSTQAGEDFRVRSLPELLETYRQWSSQDVLERVARQAEADGDDAAAALLRRTGGERDAAEAPAALEALAAQHELAEQLAHARYRTVRAARESGASWSDIGRAMRWADPRAARDEYVSAVERQAEIAEEIGIRFETERYRAAAGRWEDELRPATPPEVVEEIEQAIARDDIEQLDRLQRTWWDPSRVPAAHSVAAHPVADDTDPADGAGSTDDGGTDQGEAGRAAPPDPWAPANATGFGTEPESADAMERALARVREAEARWEPISQRSGGAFGPPPMPDFELDGPVTPAVIEEWATALHTMAEHYEARLDREEAEESARYRAVDEAAEAAEARFRATQAENGWENGADAASWYPELADPDPGGRDGGGAGIDRRIERAAAVLDADRAAGTDWGHDDRVLSAHLRDQAAFGLPPDARRVPTRERPIEAMSDAELLVRAEQCDNVTYIGDYAGFAEAHDELDAIRDEARGRAEAGGSVIQAALADYAELLLDDPGVERFAEFTDLHRMVHQGLDVDPVPPHTDPDGSPDATAERGVRVAVASPAGEHDRHPGETRDERAAAAAAGTGEHDGAARGVADPVDGRGEWGLSDHDRDRLVDALDPTGAAERAQLREAINPATVDDLFGPVEADFQPISGRVSPSTERDEVGGLDWDAQDSSRDSRQADGWREPGYFEPVWNLGDEQGPAYNPAAEFGDPDYREPASEEEANARLERIAAWQQRTPEDEAWLERVTALMGEPDPVADAAQVAARIEHAEGPNSDAARAAWAEHGRRLDAATEAPTWELGDDAASWRADPAARDADDAAGLVTGTIVLPGGLPPEDTADDEALDEAPELDDDGPPEQDRDGYRWGDMPDGVGAFSDGEQDPPATAEPSRLRVNLTEVAEPSPGTTPWWETDAGRAHAERARELNPGYDPTDKPSRPDDLEHLRQRLDQARDAVRSHDAGHAREPRGDDDAEDDPAARREQLTRWHTDDHASDAAHDAADNGDGDGDG